MILSPADYHLLEQHLQRHYLENGVDTVFMPEQSTEDLLSSYLPSLWEIPYSVNGWQRVFASRDHLGRVIAHCVLTQNFLAPHRASIACGVERKFHRHGIGSSLMKSAIATAKEQGLRWLDGTAVASNHPVLAMDLSLGFRVSGLIEDSFRVSGTSYAQYILTLDLR